ncbi:MAG: hypothetical protein U0457_05650 [Candidatus Sericytochromatia bacterium]
MESVGNLSKEFNASLQKASLDKKLTSSEITDLKSKAITNDDKKVLELIEKGKKDGINFNVKSSENDVNYNLSFIEDEKNEAIKPNINDKKFQMPNTSYSSLGVGDKNVELKINGESGVLYSKPVGSLDEIANKFNDPHKVAQLVGSMGSYNYDHDRAAGTAVNGPAGAKKPEDTLNDFKGVCRDVHQLAAYMLKKNGYDAVQVGYTSAQTSHSITSYKEPSGKGYGIIEYDKVYTPEDVKKLLGRYATSPEEAVNALNYGTAAAIYKWTPPKEGESGHVEGIFYTSKFQNYHKSLKLEHKDQMLIDSNLGIQLEKTLGDKFSVKLGYNPTGGFGDPTAKNSVNTAIGYKLGNENNFLKASVGIQYRPEDGSRQVGSTNFIKNPTLLAGTSIEGQLRPINAKLGENHYTATTITGRLAGGLAFNGKEKSDAGKIETDGKFGFDESYTSGLADLKLGVDQRFYGDLGKGFSYSAGMFANYDGNLAVAGIAMGGNPFEFTNLGVNGRLNYDKGNFSSSVYGQYMLNQVNNLDNSMVGASASYRLGKIDLYGGANYVNSLEGGRGVFETGGSYDISKIVSVSAGAKQEIVGSKTDGVYAGETAGFIKGTFKF